MAKISDLIIFVSVSFVGEKYERVKRKFETQNLNLNEQIDRVARALD